MSLIRKEPKRSLDFAFVVVLIAVGLVSCSTKRTFDEGLRQEVEALEGKTTPPEATLIARSAPVRGDWSVTASWDIETTLSTAEYSKWVISQLQPEFKLVREDDAELVLAKSENTDTHSIECQFMPLKGDLHVHVEFSAHPD